MTPNLKNKTPCVTLLFWQSQTMRMGKYINQYIDSFYNAVKYKTT